MSEQASAPSEPKPRLNPSGLAVADAARLLSRPGARPITEAMIRADLDAGAPVNADGTISLVHYAAWLVKEMVGGADGD